MSLLLKGSVGFLGVGSITAGAVYLGTDVFKAKKEEKKTSIKELLKLLIQKRD